jgi:hypothetical protein
MRRSALTISALFLIAGMALAAPVVPVDPAFEWTNWSRTLYYQILPNANGFPVNAPLGYIEPIANPTIGDSFRRASQTWTADTGGAWTLAEWNGLGQAPVPLITVRMSFPADPGNNIPAELDPPSSSDADIDGDPRGGPGGGNVLAFFRPTGADAFGRTTSAEIVFNRSASWGIDNNAAPNADFDYDPIIVALHEIGHAIRLDHYTSATDTTIGANAATVNGPIMRPRTKSGTHNTNPTNAANLAMNFARNPDAMDLAAARDAAVTPEPGTISLILAAAVVAMVALGRARA